MKPLLIIFVLMSGISAFAQTDRIDSLLNDIIYNGSDPLEMPEKPVKFDFIYAGLNYNSNSFYAGREIGSDMFNLSGNLFYYHASGIFVGVSGSWYDELEPSYTNTVISAGYSKILDKKKHFTFRTSYSRYLYNQSDSDSYAYKNNINLGMSYRKKWFGGRMGTNMLFGEESKINLSAALYSRVNIYKFGKYNKIYTAPELSVLFSKETVSTTKTSGQNPEYIPEYDEVFSLLNTQLYIPVGVSVGNFDLEFSYTVNFPTTQDVIITYPVTSFYSISLGYMLPIIR